MIEAKEFSAAAVVSAVKGTLLCDIGDVYEVLSFLVGRSVFTHELPQAGRMAEPHVFAEHPALEAVDVSGINRDNWRAELAKIEATIGKTLTLHPIGWNPLADKSPVETLVEMVGEEKVIVVESGESIP